MRLTAVLLFTSLSSAALAQTSAAHPAATHTAAHAAAAAHAAVGGGCVKLPEFSPKLPALPAGAPCARALYTITTTPDIKLDYVAPAEGDLAKELGIEPTSFTLAYVDTKVGTGELAQPHKHLTVKYTGYLADGTVFDASDKHPEKAFTFKAGEHQVVAGWDTGFAGMKVGGKRRLFIPFQLAYGPTGRPPTIPARAELIFDMELVSQSDTPPPAAAAAPQQAPVRLAPIPPRPPAPPASAAPATPPASSAPAAPPQ